MLSSDVTGSSTISAVAYDNFNLTVTFKNGSKYIYFNVPEGVYWEIASAYSNNKSAGRYFARNVRNVYKYQKI